MQLQGSVYTRGSSFDRFRKLDHGSTVSMILSWEKGEISAVGVSPRESAEMTPRVTGASWSSQTDTKIS